MFQIDPKPKGKSCFCCSCHRFDTKKTNSLDIEEFEDMIIKLGVAPMIPAGRKESGGEEKY